MTRSAGEQHPTPAPPARVDAICDAFESAWFAGREPRIEDFLSDGGPLDRDVLLRELLVAEWDLRRRRGEMPRLESYLGRFTEAPDSISNLLGLWEKQLQRATDRPPARQLAATDAPPLEQSGTLIGRYKLLEKLGEGGFGTVWAAEQREPVKRRVALKVIKLGMDTRQVVARFEAERQRLAR